MEVSKLSNDELLKLMNKVLSEVQRRLMPRSYILQDDSQYGISASFPGGSSVVDDWVSGITEDFED